MIYSLWFGNGKDIINGNDTLYGGGGDDTMITVIAVMIL